jgi:hypothetical protein
MDAMVKDKTRHEQRIMGHDRGTERRAGNPRPALQS